MISIRSSVVLVLVGSFLVFSWLFPTTRIVWDSIDSTISLSLNNALTGHYHAQNFFAWLNSRYADWMFESIAISIYIAHCFGSKSASPKKRISQAVSLVTAIIIVQIAVNKILFFNILHIGRSSPSLILDMPVDLSLFPYPNNKTFSYNSFPADHATSLFLAAFFSWSHFNRPVAITCTLLYTFLATPRLIAGAHWFSDIFFGGMFLSFVIWTIGTHIPLLFDRTRRKMIQNEN